MSAALLLSLWLVAGARAETYALSGLRADDYNRIMEKLQPGDVVTYGNGKSFHLGPLLGNGNVTRVYALADDPAAVLRIPLQQGKYRKYTYAHFLDAFYAGAKDLQSHRIPMVAIHDYLPRSYLVVDRLGAPGQALMPLDEFLSDRDLKPELRARMGRALVDFARRSADFSYIGDFGEGRQLVYDPTTARWVLADWTHSHRTASDKNPRGHVLNAAFDFWTEGSAGKRKTLLPKLEWVAELGNEVDRAVWSERKLAPWAAYPPADTQGAVKKMRAIEALAKKYPDEAAAPQLDRLFADAAARATLLRMAPQIDLQLDAPLLEWLSTRAKSDPAWAKQTDFRQLVLRLGARGILPPETARSMLHGWLDRPDIAKPLLGELIEGLGGELDERTFCYNVLNKKSELPSGWMRQLMKSYLKSEHSAGWPNVLRLISQKPLNADRRGELIDSLTPLVNSAMPEAARQTVKRRYEAVAKLLRGTNLSTEETARLNRNLAEADRAWDPRAASGFCAGNLLRFLSLSGR